MFATQYYVVLTQSAGDAFWLGPGLLDNGVASPPPSAPQPASHTHIPHPLRNICSTIAGSRGTDGSATLASPTAGRTVLLTRSSRRHPWCLARWRPLLGRCCRRRSGLRPSSRLWWRLKQNIQTEFTKLLMITLIRNTLIL